MAAHAARRHGTGSGDWRVGHVSERVGVAKEGRREERSGEARREELGSFEREGWAIAAGNRQTPNPKPQSYIRR
jgi:hypothetical protein